MTFSTFLSSMSLMTLQSPSNCALSSRRPSILRGDDATRRGYEAVRNDDLLDFLVEYVLDDFAESLELRLEFLSALLLVFVFGKFEAFLRHRHQSLSVVFFQLLDDVLVDGLRHVDHFESTLLDALDEGRVGHGLLAFAGDVVNL